MAKSPEDKPRTLTRTFTQPPDTIQYIASANDTLEKIAARYDTTPSELTKINKLSSRLIFTGQLLFVPKNAAGLPQDSPPEGSEIPPPSQAKKQSTGGSISSDEFSPTFLEHDRDCYERFLKITTRYITDGKGVVAGILLVTPNCIMFDPNVSDPLVVERGFEKYRVNAPFFLILKAGIFPDIALMRIKSLPNSPDPASQQETPPTPYRPVPKPEEPSPPPPENSCKECGDSNHSTDSTQFPFHNLCEDKLSLFADLKKLIPRPSRPSNDAPLYLCLRMGRPLKPLPLATVPKHKVHREYWFSIPQEQVDSLYNFFQMWAPETYGILDEYDAEARNLVPIGDQDSDDSDVEETFEKVPPAPAPTKKWSGSFIPPFFDTHHTEDASSHHKDSPDGDSEETKDSKKEFEIPELVDPSEILDFDGLKQLYLHFPPSTIGNQMKLFYATSKHGFSLKTLYRRMRQDYDGPVLLVVQDSENSVFGALSSSPFHCSEFFYGTGESFLYTFYPEFKVFSWTGDNTYFVRGEPTNLAIGSGEGSFGLWLDGDLYHGRSRPCITFANTVLSKQEDFVVRAIEVWGFV